MTSTSFGERLRREREMRGVTLEEISVATRISPRFLEALENEQWQNLPGGIFTRGFIRTVARFLGLDEENMIAEYSLVTHDGPEVAVWADKPGKPGYRWLPLFAYLTLLVFLLAGAGMAYRHHSAVMGAARHIRAMVAAVRWRIQGRQPAPPAPSAPLAPAPVSSAQSVSAGASSTAAAPNAADTDELILNVAAGRSTEIKITADGKVVYSGRIKTGGEQTFQARESFDVEASDPSAILVELNGITVPPLGLPGQPGRITLTRRDLEGLSGGHH